MHLHSRLPNSKIVCNEAGLKYGPFKLVVKSEQTGKFEISPSAKRQFAIVRKDGLQAIANALNEDNEARALIAVAHLRLPDLVTFPRTFRKFGFNPDQPRDDHGRWTDESGSDSESNYQSAPYDSDVDKPLSPLLVQEREDLGPEEELDPLGPVRSAEYNTLYATLKNLDPTNPQLETLTGPNYVPSQEDIDTLDAEIRQTTGIPEDWEAKHAKRYKGIEYTNSESNLDRVRIMLGNPDSPYPAQQIPYVKDQINGRFLMTDGTRQQNGKEQDSHIPVKDYKFWRKQ